MKKELLLVKTRYGAHLCWFDPDRDKGGYVVIAKDVVGVVTWGKTLAHAKKMAKEALELSIESDAIERPLSAPANSHKTVHV